MRAALMLDALGSKPAQVLRVPRQAVAHPLQLRERQQTRAGDDFISKDPPRVRLVSRRDVRECVRDDCRAFALELRDLPSQGLAHIALGDLDPGVRRSGAYLNRRSVTLPLVSPL